MNTYEKKYKEALELAKDYFKANQRLGELEENDMLSDIFPELKESEDERIRKAIIRYLKVTSPAMGENIEKMLAWLEKQGEQILANSAKTCKDEQKPSDEEIKTLLRTEYEKGRADAIAEMQKPAWSEEDEEFLRRAINATKDVYPMTAKWLKSLKDRVQPKQEWSKENDLILETIIDHIIPDKPFIANGFTDEELVTWLKSLRPQNRWKPSDEQIKALHDLNLTGNISYVGQGQVLIDLYNDLLKLKA